MKVHVLYEEEEDITLEEAELCKRIRVRAFLRRAIWSVPILN